MKRVRSYEADKRTRPALERRQKLRSAIEDRKLLASIGLTPKDLK